MRYILYLASTLLTFSIGAASATLWNSLGKDRSVKFVPTVCRKNYTYNQTVRPGVSIRVSARSCDREMYSLDNQSEKPIWVGVEKEKFKRKEEWLPVVSVYKQDEVTSDFKYIWTFGCVGPETSLRLISPYQSLTYEQMIVDEFNYLEPGNYKMEIAYLDDPKLARRVESGRPLTRKEAEIISSAWKSVSYERTVKSSTTKKR